MNKTQDALKLAIENDITVHQSKKLGYVEVVYADDKQLIEEEEYYNNDPVEVTCVAVAKALIKLKGE